MSASWSGVRAGGDGILRSASSSAAKEELLVFGYSCKLFRDDDRAREVDQGRLLIPWAGDETLRIDRYDVRGALHELSSLEAPPGGHDWRLELTDAERRVEQLCDEERYRALYCDEEEELMYKEEELKRLRAVGYGQIGFNYDAEKSGAPPPSAEPQEVDEPFAPTPQMQALLTPDVALPETQKLNAIIEKTATFIARHGAQMEILLRAKQAGNAQFNFLDKDSTLHPYYRIVLDAVRHDKLTPHKDDSEVKPEESEDYLHPSLAAPLIQSAPSIPSIHYKPSADCDYTMLISRIKGNREEEPPEPAVPAGELAPPGTQPLVLPGAEHGYGAHLHYDPTAHAQIARGPVLYAAQPAGEQQQQVAYSYPAEQPPPAAPAAPAVASGSGPASPAPLPAAKSTGLNLMHYYNSGSESEHSEEEKEAAESPLANTEPPECTPPADIQLIISKMAAYVARNGDEFQDIVKAKNDPRFTFLYESHEYYPYYKRLMLQLRGVPERPDPPDAQGAAPDTKDASTDTSKRDDKKKSILPVSFSIKKLKEPESILPKPALPYESSEDEKETATEEEGQPPESRQQSPEPAQAEAEAAPAQVPKPAETQCETKQFLQPVEKPTSKKSDEKKREKSERKHKKEKRKKENGESKKSKRDKSVSREKRQRGRSDERRERSRSRERSEGGRGGAAEGRGAKERSSEAREREEVITIEDEFIDLTGDISDGRGETEGAGDKVKQSERKRRAAAFLAGVGRDATSVTPPAVIEDNTLASAMVKTLVELHAKKEAAEERRRRREKQKRRHKRREEELESERERERERSHRKSKRRKHKTSSEEDDEYYESSSKHRKHKEEKKHRSSSKSKKKRKRDSSGESTPSPSRRQSESPLPADDKQVPTKEENGTKKSEFDPAAIKNKLKMLREELNDELEVKRWRAESQESEREKKKEYSEGEWESSEDKSTSDSGTTVTQ